MSPLRPSHRRPFSEDQSHTRKQDRFSSPIHSIDAHWLEPSGRTMRQGVSQHITPHLCFLSMPCLGHPSMGPHHGMAPASGACEDIRHMPRKQRRGTWEDVRHIPRKQRRISDPFPAAAEARQSTGQQGHLQRPEHGGQS